MCPWRRLTRTRILKELTLSVLLVLGVSTLCSAAPGIQWVKGFPQRVGGNVILMWSPAPGVDRYAVTRVNLNTRETLTEDVRGNYHVDARTKTTVSYKYQILGLSNTITRNRQT